MPFERKLKHLDFLQLVITRMNVNSFLLKGWSITLIAALFALAAKDAKIEYVLITYISTPIIWLLDGYYLSQERQYRALYNVVKTKAEENVDFDMNAHPYNVGINTWSRSMLSKTIVIFYGSLLALTLLVMYLLNKL